LLCPADVRKSSGIYDRAEIIADGVVHARRSSRLRRRQVAVYDGAESVNKIIELP
jgi:hypothetical protein